MSNTDGFVLFALTIANIAFLAHRLDKKLDEILKRLNELELDK